ncbi:MAG: sigma-E factor negative regulatory protein RseA [Candidatus Azotimanducaceae bacterium]
MTDHLKQSISALLDDEASEIEVHRLLREFGDDGDLKTSWIRYQQIRAVSQGHHHLTESQHVSLHTRISAAIQDEESHELATIQRPGWQRQVAGFAVAASLVAAVLVGVNLNQPGNLVTPALVETQSPEVINTQTVSFGSDDDNYQPNTDIAFSEDELELRELDEVKQQQLREYLMRHDRMSRMNSNTRTVNYQPKTGNN